MTEKLIDDRADVICVRGQSRLGTFVVNDIEAFVFGRRLKVRRDGVELRLRGPGSAAGEVLASFLELTLAQSVRSVDEVQLMPGVRVFEDCAEPSPLRLRVAGEVEDDGDALGEERAHVWLERTPESRGVLDEIRDVDDLARVEAIQELVLHEQDGLFSRGQIAREGRFASRHLTAQEHQLRLRHESQTSVTDRPVTDDRSIASISLWRCTARSKSTSNDPRPRRASAARA